MLGIKLYLSLNHMYLNNTALEELGISDCLWASFFSSFQSHISYLGFSESTDSLRNSEN